jgi:hypothetical protein
LYATLDTRFDNTAHCFHALDMACHARHKTLGGPTPVTIHNDGNMARHLCDIRYRDRRTCMIHQTTKACFEAVVMTALIPW